MNLQMAKSASAPGFYDVGTIRPTPAEMSGMGTTFHEHLQRTLAERELGGPREQIRPAPYRLRHTRCTDVVHSSMQDPLAPYKTLEPMHPRLKSTQRRYHLTDGYKCFDGDTICVSARDMLTKTKSGLLRASSGTVTYSDTHRKKLELDLQELVRILAHEGIPGSGHAWTPKKLERIFKERTGRPGVWNHYEVPFGEFLKAFPRTFDLFNRGEFIRLQRQRKTVVMDSGEDALVRLARAREYGYVEQQTAVIGQGHEQAQAFIDRFGAESEGLKSQVVPKPVVLPALKLNRLKTNFRLHDRYLPEREDEEERLSYQADPAREADENGGGWHRPFSNQQNFQHEAMRSDRTNL